nr:immunoglobulin heavy chain junction region [Mus musculus]
CTRGGYGNLHYYAMDYW